MRPVAIIFANLVALMHKPIAVLLLTALTIVVVAANSAQAGLVALRSSSPSKLYDVNSSTGLATLKVALGLQGNLVGLEYLNGTYYATDVFVGGSSRFGSINPITGAFTSINTQNGSSNWQALAGNQGAGLLYSFEFTAPGALYSITPSGVITTIGNAGVLAARGAAYDDDNGILYMVGAPTLTNPSLLYRVNTTTAAATLIGSTGILSSQLGLAFDRVSHVLYMTAEPVINSNSFLYTVNVTTGAATLVGDTGIETLDGLAWVPPVPEPNSLVLSAFGLISLALYRWRRRSRT